MNLLGHALDAVRRGLFVFPVEPMNKTPARLFPHRSKEDAPWTFRWSEVATRHVPTVVQWWNECPDRNIGVACKQSGLLVVDCDLKPGHDGFLEWSSLAAQYDAEWFMRYTLTVRTGGGGCHMFYRWPEGVQASQSGLSAHVDIRSNGGDKGGYVLGAGSQTSKGSYQIEEDEPIANAPDWLIELCRDKPRPKPVKAPFSQPSSLNFTGLQTAVGTAAEGNRNAVLFWSARSMVTDGADIQTAIDLLVPSATGNGLDEAEANATIRSAYRLQSSKG
jgi:Bifunctional DNA primase/polymerase, N-terminal